MKTNHCNIRKRVDLAGMLYDAETLTRRPPPEVNTRPFRGLLWSISYQELSRGYTRGGERGWG